MIKFLPLDKSALKSFIHNAYIIDLKEGEEETYNCLPSVFPTLSILFKAKLETLDSGFTILPSRHLISSHIVLPYTKPIKVVTKGPFQELVIAFKPFVLDCFVDKEIENLGGNTHLSPKLLLGKEFALLEKELAFENIEPDEKLNLLLDFLQRKGETNGMLSSEFQPQNRLKALNKLPERSFYRQFKELAYLTPKQYERIIRLRDSLNQAKQESQEILTGIAYDQGYFDQSHFSKDCKRISGKSPKRLIKSLVSHTSDALWYEEL